jgi:hypothetical protein
LAVFDSGRPLHLAKGSTEGLRYIAEMAAKMVTKHAKWLRK